MSDDVSLGRDLDFLKHLWRLNHALERRSAAMEQEHGVTAQQRLMIRCIGKFPGVTAGRLAEILHVDPSTTSTALRRLREKGLVATRRDPTDSRRAFIGLTEKGRSIDALRTGTVEAAVGILLGESSSAEVGAVERVLARLTELLEERP